MNKDTFELLSECNAGVKMAVSSIDDVLDSVENESLRNDLIACKQTHQRLGSRTHALLNAEGEAGKPANPMARAMSWVKTNTKLAMQPNDHTVADLIVDGCNMGVKSLIRYRNQYPAATEQAKAIAGELIASEEHLSSCLKHYL